MVPHLRLPALLAFTAGCSDVSQVEKETCLVCGWCVGCVSMQQLLDAPQVSSKMNFGSPANLELLVLQIVSKMNHFQWLGRLSILREHSLSPSRVHHRNDLRVYLAEHEANSKSIDQAHSCILSRFDRRRCTHFEQHLQKRAFEDLLQQSSRLQVDQEITLVAFNRLDCLQLPSTERRWSSQMVSLAKLLATAIENVVEHLCRSSILFELQQRGFSEEKLIRYVVLSQTAHQRCAGVDCTWSSALSLCGGSSDSNFGNRVGKGGEK
jgi:hypothetical protein